MKKKALAVLLSAAMSLSLVACSNKGSQSNNNSNDGKLEDTLVVYTTHPEDMLDKISEEFTKETGVNVEFINLKGELADRVRREKGEANGSIIATGSEIQLALDIAEELIPYGIDLRGYQQ